MNLISRPDYDGFGFSIRPSERGPHQVSNVEPGSPGAVGGLRLDDFILKVNDTYVVGQRFSKTAATIKNESDKGRIKLEVVEPSLCPEEIRAVPLLEPASANATVKSTSKSLKSAESIQNLKQVAAEALAGANTLG